MYVICSGVSFVEISSPNECDKILKIQNEQTEPTDYTANYITDRLSSNLSVPILGLVRDSFQRQIENT